MNPENQNTAAAIVAAIKEFNRHIESNGYSSNQHAIAQRTRLVDALIEMGKIAPAPSPDRVKELEELVRSACAIAERQGRNTHWGRFIASVHAAELSSATARTYKLLEGESETPSQDL
jgi:hypothetical protein